MKRLLLGPAGSGKTHQILDEFEKQLASSAPLSEDAFFVLPSSEHTQRVMTLLLQRGIKGFFHRRVITLPNLLSQIFSPGDARFASNATRFMILQEIFSSKKWDYFSLLQNTPGFLNLILSFIAELKESFISPADFRKRMNELKNLESDLASKYEALAGIYESYEEALNQRGLLDRQDPLRLLREKGESFPARKRFKKLWLDGFFDFSNLQLEYLKELLNYTDEITITLTLDEAERRPQLFEMIRKTEHVLKKMGFKNEALKPRTQQPVLSYVERHLFLDGKLPVAPKPEETVRIFEAVGIQGEVEMLAREILHLYRKGNYRFSDFAILLRQIGGYESIIRSVFSRYEIPVEIHERERLKLSPVIETLRSLLRIYLEGWHREPLLNFLKSSYVTQLGPGIAKDYEWVCGFENEAYQEGILTGKENWLRPWFGQKNSPETRNIEKNKNLKALIQLEEALQKAQIPKQMENLLRQALEQTFGIFRREDRYEEPVRRDASSQARVEALFEEIRNQFLATKQTSITFQNYAEHLLRLLEIDLYSLHERNANRVQVYDISLARQKEYRVVFVAGLLEKSFPVHIKEDPLLSDWERELFNQGMDFKLSLKLPRQHLERYLFYLAVTRASEKLILSCPRLDLEGKESLPSFYLDETDLLFQNKIVRKKQDLSHPYPLLEDVVSERELEIGVMGELWHNHPAVPKNFLTYLSAQMLSQDSVRQKFQTAFQEIKSEIQDTRILTGGFFKSDRTSATTLEDYAKCPYRYFSKRVLKLKDPREEINTRLKGTIRHQVLEYYFKHRFEKGALSEEATKAFVQKELERALREHPLVIERRYQKDLYEAEIRDMLFFFLEKELEALEETPLQPRYFEFAFGTGEKPDAPALEIQDGGRTFKVVGKIDRIDLDPKQGIALVMDYKTAAVWSKKHLENGFSLQLPIYVMAVEKFLNLKPAGAQLRFLKTGQSQGFYHKDFAGGYDSFKRKTLLSDSEFRALLENTLQYLKQFTREMAEGKIPVMPREKQSCDYCSYTPVCRIQKWRLPLIAEEVKQKEQLARGIEQRAEGENEKCKV